MRVSIGELTGLRKRRKWCDGKRQFSNPNAAEAVLLSIREEAATISRKALDDANALRIYPCDNEFDGPHFHIGHWRNPHSEPYERVQARKAGKSWR